MHHKHFILETFSPLIIWISAINLADINTVINTIGGAASAIYALIKINQHFKEKKTKTP